jgi:hypothetical protein
MRIMNIRLPAFQTLDMAGEYLAECIDRILSLLSTTTQSHGADPDVDVVEAIQDLDARLYKWMNLFQNLTATGPVYQRRMLIVHNVAASVLLERLKAQVSFAFPVESELPPPEPPRCRYRFVVLEVEDMLKHKPGAFTAPPSLGFIPPMFLAASSSPKVETRRRAINVLRLLVLTEGAWNTDMAANIAEAMLDIVYQFSIAPTEVELRHMSFGVDSEQARQSRVLYMRWEPEYEQFQGVDFVREIEVDTSMSMTGSSSVDDVSGLSSLWLHL